MTACHIDEIDVIFGVVNLDDCEGDRVVFGAAKLVTIVGARRGDEVGGERAEALEGEGEGGLEGGEVGGGVGEVVEEASFHRRVVEPDRVEEGDGEGGGFGYGSGWG